MGEFLRAVQKGEVKGPQQIAFSEQAWTVHFSDVSEPDEDDNRLYTSGLWFARHFAAVRVQVEAAEGRVALTSDDSKALLVGMANASWLAVHRELRRHAQRDNSPVVAIEELEQLNLPNEAGNPLHPTSTIENIVDGLRFPLARTVGQLPAAKISPAEQFSVHRELVRLGQYYHVLEHLWMQCVWNRFVVHEEDSQFVIRSGAPELARQLVISSCRRSTRQIEMTMLITSLWLKFPEERRNQVLAGRWVLSAQPRDRRWIVKACSADRFPDLHAHPAASEYSVEDHLEGILVQRYRCLRGLSPRHVLSAFELLGCLPAQITRLQEQHPTSANYSRIVARADLKSAFQRALEITPEQADFILQQMTWEFNRKVELWFRPLVPVGIDQFLIPFAAIDGINYLRLVDEILQRFPNVRQQADEAFEPHFRSALAKSIREGPLNAMAAVHPVAYTPEKKFKAVGDIDLLVRVGSKILVGEIKSARHAYAPLEESRYFERLRKEAVVQARRKSAFVADHLPVFRELLHITAPSEVISVHPVVVANSALFAGFPIEGVPVVDALLLHRFFKEGKMEVLGGYSHEGSHPPVETIHFYRSPTEAIDNLIAYLLDPPQLRELSKFVQVERSKLLDDGSGKPAVLDAFIIKQPVQDWKALINAAAHARGERGGGS